VSEATLPSATTVGPVHLTVSNLDRSLPYYTETVGLDALEQDDTRALLGRNGRTLIGLVEEPDARPAPGTTGLYHFALLVPERVNLARWLAHAARDRVPLVGLSDHDVSEAIYLRDPDGHGIEIYADRPRERWEGKVDIRMTTLPLDVDSLLAELEDPAEADFDGLPAGTTMGHVHLKVADVPSAVAFYRDVLGLELTVALGRQAAFFAAGGYHHHVGANTWESADGPPPSRGSASLRHATIVVPMDGDRDAAVTRLRAADVAVDETPDGPAFADPSGNRLVLLVAHD